MKTIEENSVRQWSLSLSDTISTKFQCNVHFKEYRKKELVYTKYLEEKSPLNWATLCENKEENKSILTAISYPCIIGTTNQFFSNAIMVDDKESLSFSELFIAENISKEISRAFVINNINVEFVRNEKKISLVHPFHEDESIIEHLFSWYIGNHTYGELSLCHSHVL